MHEIVRDRKSIQAMATREVGIDLWAAMEFGIGGTSFEKIEVWFLVKLVVVGRDYGVGVYILFELERYGNT